MAQPTPFEEAKGLTRQLTSVLAPIDTTALPREQRELVLALKQLLEHVRLGSRDYEYADTRVEQLRYATETKQHLEKLQVIILKASEYNLLGSIDVAITSAHIQQLISDLQ